MQLLNFKKLIKPKPCKVYTLIYISLGKQAHRTKTFLVGHDSVGGIEGWRMTLGHLF